MKVIKRKVSGEFMLAILFAVILIQFPYIRILNTLIHETGHAVIALIGGHMETISLLENSEGVTYGKQPIWLVSVITSAAGYFFSSFVAFIAFSLIHKQKQIWLIDLLLGILFLNLLLWVRNLFGIIWLISFVFGFLILLIKATQAVRNTVVLVMASVLLVDSLLSAYEVMILSFFHPKFAGDAANLAQLTSIIPVHIWGILFFTQAIVFLIIGLKKEIYQL